jgi:class 3 adenylate cyclase/tetratricopeptide (TPR) repeat protein
VPAQASPAAYTPKHLEREVLVFRDAEAGERKEVSVLIADVAGSLAMADALDPEDVHAMMDGFFALALEAVHGQRGTVNQFRGDGFMALFGAPRAQGDHTARALRAALEVRERSRTFAEGVRARYGLPFSVRIGVSTGLVWVGSIGNELRRDYTAEGSTVGLAARLEALADPGQILIDGESARRADGFEVRSLGLRSVRGRSEPEPVSELIREAPAASRLGAGRDVASTPFVGRAAELERLQHLLLDAGTRAVEVRGEAGIGKSRIVVEALRRLPARTAALELAAREASQIRAYVPWLQLLRHWPPEWPGAQPAEALAQTLGGGAGQAYDPDQVTSALRDLLGELITTRPVVIFVDDAHWLDPSSRRVVEALTREPPEGRVVWLATLRDDQPEAWGATGPVQRIELAPLAPEEARRLAERAAEGLDHELAELACLRGGGNPLFVEEVARSLREGSDALRETARLELRLARAPERIPGTLRGVVAARIDALPEDAKRVLEVGAVVGERFDLELLADVLPGLAEALPVHLALLVERGLLRVLPRGDYDFRHGVVQAGAEAQLVRERLGTFHRRIAEALVKRPVAESADGASRIGLHYDEAGDALAAVPHLLRAGRGYLELRAFSEAAAHLRRAFERLRGLDEPQPALEAQVGLALATALGALDRTGEAAAVLEALDLEHAGAEQRLPLAAQHIQAGWLRFSNDNDVARGRALVERGLHEAEQVEHGGDLSLLGWSYLTRMDLLDARLDDALRSAARAAELTTARGDPVGLGLARYNECWIFTERGDVPAARAAADDALGLTRSARGSLLETMAQCAHARVLLFEGDARGALEIAQRGEGLAERAGHMGFRSHALVVRGYAHLLRGEARAAHECFEALLELDARWPSTALHRARGALEVGDVRGAADLARGALDAPRGVRVRALGVLGLALGLGAGEQAEAEEVLAEAVSESEALGLRPGVAEAQGFLAELCQRRGEQERAGYYAELSAGLYERCRMPLHARHAAWLVEGRHES